MSYWYLFGILSLILLVIYFKKTNNSVWGGLTIGVVVGFIAVIIFALLGNGFDWGIIIKSIIVFVLFGFFAELLGLVSDYLKKK